MHRGTLFGLFLVLGCEKKAAEGLPPADHWKPATTQPGQPAAPGQPDEPAQANGATGAENPHAGMVPNPHGADPGAAGVTPVDPQAGSPHGAGANPHGMDPGAAGATGSSDLPAADPTPPTTLTKRPDGRLVLGPFTLAAPAEWVAKPVTSSMRAASFLLSAKPNEEAELVVYYFGENGAGTVEANLDRWVEQFQQPDGKPSKGAAKIEKQKIAGQDATLVSVSGRYTAMAMPGAPAGGDKANQALLGAIIESPKGPYYFKLVGAKKTVDAHAKRFRAMLSSLALDK